MNTRGGITLGILVAAGGFVDIGHIVFATKAGARFGYGLLWALVLGVFGLIVLSEMTARVAAVSKKAPFDLVRDRYDRGVGIATLTGSLIAALAVCAAEIAGVATVLRMLTGWQYLSAVLVATAALALIEWVLPARGVQRVLGYLGLGMVVFVAAMIAARPNAVELLTGLVPGNGITRAPLDYVYLALGMIAATLMPYHVYFRSSLDAEQRRALKRLPLDRLVSAAGAVLGSLLVVGIVAVAASVLGPAGISAERLSSAAGGPAAALGRAGLLAALFGMLFSIGGAALRTSASAAESLTRCTGRYGARCTMAGSAVRSKLTWSATFALAAAIAAIGIDVFLLTELAVVLSVAVLPLTYLPVLMVADDAAAMGPHVNSALDHKLGWLVFAMIVLVAFTAVPLMILANVGRV